MILEINMAFSSVAIGHYREATHVPEGDYEKRFLR